MFENHGRLFGGGGALFQPGCAAAADGRGDSRIVGMAPLINTTRWGNVAKGAGEGGQRNLVCGKYRGPMEFLWEGEPITSDDVKESRHL